MSIPDYQSLMLPVLRLAAGHGEARIGEAVTALAEHLALTPEERAQLLPSGKQTVLANRVHWAKTYLVKSGLLEGTRRGHFQITSRGKSVLEANPERIDNRFLDQFEEFRQYTDKSVQDPAATAAPLPPPSNAQTATPDEIMRMAHRQIEAALAQELLDRIHAAPP